MMETEPCDGRIESGRNRESAHAAGNKRMARGGARRRCEIGHVPHLHAAHLHKRDRRRQPGKEAMKKPVKADHLGRYSRKKKTKKPTKNKTKTKENRSETRTASIGKRAETR